MSKSSVHNGYTIESTPFQLGDGLKWQVLIGIWEASPVVTKKWVFSTEGRYVTQEEADLHGLGYGQRIVDGKVPGVVLEREGVGDDYATSADR